MSKSKKVVAKKKQEAVYQEPILKPTSKFNFTLEEGVVTGLLVLLLFLVYIIRSKFLYIPFERDEGIYSYFGKLILEGKIPYKDFYEVKFPGIFYFYGFMVSVFGATVKGMHLGFLYLNLATIIIIYNASRQLFSPIAGLISAITFAFVSLTPNLSGFTIQAEHGVAFFTSLGILFYALSKKHSKWYWYGLMGLAMGCAFMVKTSGVLFCLWGGIIILLDFIFTSPKNYKSFFINISSYTIGGVSIVALLFLIIYSKGSFDDMYYWTFEHSKQYVGAMPFEEGIKYFKYTRDAILENYKMFWYHSILAVLLIWFKGIDLKLKFFGLTLSLFSFLTVVPGFYFYGHYFIQTIPGFSVVAGLTYYCFNTILKNTFKVKKEGVKYLYLVVFCFLTFSHFNAQKSYYLSPNYEQILRTIYGNNPFPESMEIANYINANAKPEDNIVLIGSEPQIYFYTNKKCPSRHAYFTALVNNVPKHKEWQKEFISDVEKVKPRYFVFFKHSISLLVQQGADTYVFEWANKYINENYKLVGLIDMPPNARSIYVWNEQLNTYKPTSETIIYIFELK
ncbi:MAG: glycosyltransferase family 39 protein [Bacteroidota bacterium]